jgi:CheY-like chemotaxis protein
VEPDIVPNGSEAVSRVMDTRYDLVFMDVYMPEMDGTEAARIIKAEMGDQGPFLVALTAASMEGEKEKFLAAGMDDYIAKPLNKKMLEDFFEKFFQE